MLRQAVSRVNRVAVGTTQRRQMGGGPYPYNLGVKKNKFIEEWNGRREITEKAFNASAANVPWIITLCLIVPYGVYTVVRDELSKTGGRRYKEMC